jgi:hypothetical protein
LGERRKEKMQISKKKLIPVVLLLAVLGVSIAYGSVWYLVTTKSSSSTVGEDISYTLTSDFFTIYPGETSNWVFTIANAKSSGPQTVIITGSLSGTASNVSVSDVHVYIPTVGPYDFSQSQLSSGITFSVPASITASVTIYVAAGGNCAPGTFEVTANIYRI